MANNKKRYALIRFDWAMKKMLRQKANFDILEGFLSELLKEKVKVKSILESEGNKEEENDKYNRVDIFVENEKGELVIIEVQNTQEYDYFHRILFGVSKAITEYIQEGDAYAKIKKVISITIAYFDLAQGKDYIYHGTTNFIGIHKKDKLDLSIKQKELYGANTPSDLYPEYWLLKVSNYKNRLKDPFDEWMYFLKNAEVLEDFTAQGLPEAKEKLDEMKLPETELAAYRAYKRKMHDRASEEYNKSIETQEKIEQAKQEGIKEAEAKAAEKEEQNILEMYADGMPIEKIAKYSQKTVAGVEQILKKHKKNKN